MTYFHEEQRFRGSWLWALVAIPLVVVFGTLAAVPRADLVGVFIAIAICLLVALLFWFARLETTVSDDGVVVTFHGLWPTRRIRFAEVAEVAPLRYSWLQSGGWGVHLGLAGMTYNVSGNAGLHFRLKNGAGVLVGTQRPEEFAAAVSKAMATRGAS
ncbi:MAG TPA: hypothetical protein VGA38_00820 [Candidatus Limnocylindria bacterium]